MAYDITKYWGEREDPVGELEDTHYEFIAAQTKYANKILDFGTGTGRMLQHFPSSAEIKGFDISVRYKDRALKEAQRLDLDFKLNAKSKLFKKLPYKNDSFDVVVASQVLLHDTPDRIHNTISELKRVGDAVVVIDYSNSNKKANLKPHNYAHDYASIVEELGFSINNYVEFSNGIAHFVIV